MSSTVALHAGHVVATTAMLGLIWFVQVVHYPLFAAVGTDRFVAYEHAHTARTAWVVGPFMAVEGLAAVAIVATADAELGLLLPLTGLGLLAVVHASTVLLQVPAHRALSEAADPAVMQRLVASNWIRTTGWSVRAVLAMAMLLTVSG